MPRPARCLLRGHRRRPDGARRCDVAGVARRQRDRAHHHGDRARAPGGRRDVRCALELGWSRAGGARLRPRAGRRDPRHGGGGARARAGPQRVGARLVAFVIVALASVAVPALYVLRARNAPETPAALPSRPTSPPADTGPWTLPRPPV